MSTTEYIESGALEAYILGALTREEAAEVERNISRSTELTAELKAIEETMLRFTSSFSKEPPAYLKDKIWSTFGTDSNAGPKLIPLQPEYRKPATWKYAAIWIALAGSAALNLALWNQGKEAKEQNNTLATQVNQMQAQQQQLTALVTEYQKNKSMMADTGMQTIVMHTIKQGHPMAATLYWSKTKGEAYVSIDALPAPPKGMQYQLWVMQGGKPVDMGVIGIDMANTPNMQKVAKLLTSGEAFAISLEKEGGSPTPTMENIYVMGKPS
ncbi:MAG: anti-sigma factor [Bacteroidota bacterium]